MSNVFNLNRSVWSPELLHPSLSCAVYRSLSSCDQEHCWHVLVIGHGSQITEMCVCVSTSALIIHNIAWISASSLIIRLQLVISIDLLHTITAFPYNGISLKCFIPLYSSYYNFYSLKNGASYFLSVFKHPPFKIKCSYTFTPDSITNIINRPFMWIRPLLP